MVKVEMYRAVGQMVFPDENLGISALPFDADPFAYPLDPHESGFLRDIRARGI